MDNKYTLKALFPIIIFTICSITFLACEDKLCRDIPDISSIDVSVEKITLEDELMGANSWEEVEAFLSENRVFADYFLHANQYPHDSILAKRVYRLLKAPSVDTLFMESKQVFANMDDILADYRQAYQIINYHYPNTPVPKLATVVTAFYNDLYISDSLIIVGLDYFLGTEATFRPDEHQYILKRFKKESLVPTIMNFVSNEFNQIDQTHNTLLSDMVNIGKSFYFTSQVLPCTPDSLIIGYTAEEIKLVNENQEIIWANLIENELLYERNDYMKNKFIGERPNVSEISENCPGRVGAWLGWEIVKKYMERNSDVTITELMAETDAHKIFQMAKYRPKNFE
ncbi:gliding motility lipoprotein GldB [Reichenbachiella sp. MALMAid0571]|uniref:gliding motility lipoprotein GldB n=1 Tax=Reichenbachiella sp. MALMAid0571 TaxID=3143939 RepID=UPI0032DE7001